MKLVPIAHGSTAEQAYGVQEIPSEPYVHPLDEVVRTIRIIPLREENMHIYPRTYIRNIRIRRKDMTIVDNPFPQPYIQGVGPNSCRNKVNMSKLSKKAQKDLMKRNVRIQKVSTEKKVSVQYTDFCFRPIDDGPKIIEQVIISPPNPDLPVESLVESSNDDISMVEQSSDSIENVEVIYGNVEVVQPSESEFIVADNLLSSLDQISLEDYGPLVPSVETNDFALDAA